MYRTYLAQFSPNHYTKLAIKTFCSPDGDLLLVLEKLTVIQKFT